MLDGMELYQEEDIIPKSQKAGDLPRKETGFH